MGLDFVALDFETANRSPASACAVGAVRVRDGHVVDEYFTLVRPAEGFDDFEPGNIRVHGITADAVESSPSWTDVYGPLRAFIGDDVVVGHNAAFDMSVLLNTSGAHDIDLPVLSSLCTLQLARASIKVPSYSLPWVVEHLNLPAFDHHDPLADARASAMVLVALAASSGVQTVAELSDHLRVPKVPTWTERDDMVFADLSAQKDDLIGTGFTGEVVCFTGALKMMVRDRARELVVEQGGKWQDGVTKATSILVTGDFDERTFRPGAPFSTKLEKAFAQVDAGQKLEIITEEAFIARMTIGEQELRARLGAANARTKVPEWVVTQAGEGPSEDYWDWYRTALAHPSGRAAGGEPCIWCATPVPVKTHWIHRDRHVCGVYCNERLKRGARRAWEREGITVPAMNWEW